MQNSNRQIAVALWMIVVFTIVQLVLLFVFGYTPYPDSNGYCLLAKDAVANNDIYPVREKLTELSFLWNVGAINAVVTSLKLFGSVTPLLILYSLMKGATALLLFLWVRNLTNERIALTTLVIYLLYPANYGESTSALSELPFMFFVTAALWLMSRKKLLACGLSIAIANWFRPMGLVYIVGLTLYFLFLYAAEKRDTLKLFLRKSSVMIVGFVLGLTIIGSLAYHRTGHFFYQAATGWMALMQYSWDNDSDTAPDSVLFAGGNPNIIVSEKPTDVMQKDSVWRSHFFLWLGQNKGEYLRQMPRKLLKTYISDNTTFCAFLPDKAKRKYMYEELSMESLCRDFPRFSPTQLLTLVNLCFYYVVIILSFLSVLSEVKRCLHRRYNQATATKKISSANLPTIFLCTIIPVVGTAVLLFFGHGESRFHQPFMPLFFTMTAVFVLGLRRGRA